MDHFKAQQPTAKQWADSSVCRATVFAMVVTAAWLLVSLTNPAGASVEPQAEQAKLLQQTDLQRDVSSRTRRFLGQYHYQPASINDELSQHMFDDYLEGLDPGKAYFTQTDIEYFSRYQTQMDDYLRRDDASPAYEIFNVYRQRVDERIKFALSQLEQPFDFTVDESLMIDREDAQWAANEQALNDYWRKRVKNDWLRLKLTDKEPDEIRETLEKRYSELQGRIDDLDGSDIFQYYMNAYLASVEPHTSYFSPRTSENFEISMSLSFEGIGALLGTEGEYTIIREIVPGGPADLDNRLQPGDRIVGVSQDDDEVVDVIGWRIDDVVDLIRGPKDSTVVIDTLPADSGLQGPSVPIDIVRNEIQLEEQAAKSEIIEIPDLDKQGNPTTAKLGVIELPTFYLDFAAYSENKPNYRSSTRDVRKLINELKREGVSGIVMDLRNNGGGSLLEATTLTGLFIDQGPVVQVRDSRERVEIEADNEPGTVWSGPLAVLVNRYSASASEIFAAALQDYGRAVIVGEPTFGKGTVQHLINLDGRREVKPEERRGQLKMTMAQFFRIDGGSTQNRGVIPDVVLPSAGDPAEYGESSLDNALPWTRIEPAEYSATQSLQALLPRVTESYQQRISNDPEFDYLRDDIAEYEKRLDRKEISLLESTRREEREQNEQRRKQRKAQREKMLSGVIRTPFGNQPEPEQEDEQQQQVEVAVNATTDTVADATDATTDAEEEEEEQDNPDIYLEETARILADINLLQSENRVLAARADLPSNSISMDANKKPKLAAAQAATSKDSKDDGEG